MRGLCRVSDRCSGEPASGEKFRLRSRDPLMRSQAPARRTHREAAAAGARRSGTWHKTSPTRQAPRRQARIGGQASTARQTAPAESLRLPTRRPARPRRRSDAAAGAARRYRGALRAGRRWCPPFPRGTARSAHPGHGAPAGQAERAAGAPRPGRRPRADRWAARPCSRYERHVPAGVRTRVSLARAHVCHQSRQSARGRDPAGHDGSLAPVCRRQSRSTGRAAGSGWRRSPWHRPEEYALGCGQCGWRGHAASTRSASSSTGLRAPSNRLRVKSSHSQDGSVYWRVPPRR